MTDIDINDLSFNRLDKETRLEHLKPTMMNPFDLPEGYKVKMMNPFTMIPIGDWDDGITIQHDVFDLKIYRKYLIKDNKVTNVWKVNDDNEYEEVLPYEDGTWDNKLFK